jgi:hypothetical protein
MCAGGRFRVKGLGPNPLDGSRAVDKCRGSWMGALFVCLWHRCFLGARAAGEQGAEKAAARGKGARTTVYNLGWVGWGWISRGAVVRGWPGA